MVSLPILLTLHGAIVLFIGMLCGIPQGIAITNKQGEDVIRAWRVAHSGLTAGGTTLIASSAVLASLNLGETAMLLLVWAMAMSGYGFAVALPYGAWVGQRGISAQGNAQNKFVYAGNMVGAVGSLVGGLLLIWGCIKTLW